MNLREHKYLKEKGEGGKERERERERVRVVLHILIFSFKGKTIVGHNMLLDLCHIIRQFVTPLPADYAEFKNLVHNLFPR